MTEPEIDPATAESMEEDADFAGEHTKPTYADEDSPENTSEESVPDEEGGMELKEQRRPD
ncbi:hypothetical protein DMH04_55285 [Kibdelosporangium aridum]|uniref:Uncharacterized protein n=1 Tax=Kibdelosporangium aridum TaxID=2030 RepID=A0A428XWP8_KIBAR|nr:hypothetical protein [Kibdelosporangium aridum]RSM59748.1 hypothetical protein DMH04_55285 [Kibdelosporangium aridum]